MERHNPEAAIRLYGLRTVSVLRSETDQGSLSTFSYLFFHRPSLLLALFVQVTLVMNKYIAFDLRRESEQTRILE